MSGHQGLGRRWQHAGGAPSAGGPRRRGAPIVAALIAVLGALTPAADAAAPEWHTAWTRSQAPAFAALPLTDQTVRVFARVYGGGSAVRVRLQNAFGKTPRPDGTPPLMVNAAAIGIRLDGAALVPGSNRPLTFGGERSITVAAGEYVLSDPVRLDVRPQQDVAISVHTTAAVPPAHAEDTVTHAVTPAGGGDRTMDETGAPYSGATTSTPIAAAVDVYGTSSGAIVAIGGSVVDGSGSTRDGYDTWPDILGQRILAELPPREHKTVANAGIGGTTAAAACSVPTFGPPVQERLERDVLSLAGVTHIVVYAGTNDLAFGCTGDQIIAAYDDVIAQAHRAKAKVLITTITPRASYSAAQNAHRAQVNAWVLEGGDCSGSCDHALDFDAAVRDPENPNRLDPQLDSGDGIHPNGRGYRAIAESIDLCAFERLGCGPLLKPGETGAPQDLGLPPAGRACVSRRNFAIHLRAPKGAQLRSARVFVNGRRVALRRRGGRLTARVDLRGQPKRVVRVRIVARTTKGRTVVRTRSYRTCVPKRG